MKVAATQRAESPASEPSANGRRPLAQLLHALNQPLTGLQCSLELAAATPRSPQQYARTVNEALDLTQRLRSLVEAIREVVDDEGNAVRAGTIFEFDRLIEEVAAELRPVAEDRSAKLVVACQPRLPVCSDHARLSALVFRLLESAVSLAHAQSTVRVACRREVDSAVLAVAWREEAGPAQSALSQAELGLLVAQAGWETVGAAWECKRSTGESGCTVRLLLAGSNSGAGADSEIR
ncbi:MAG TPA: histidine kinase dimerization/phospho-acceptor domain-containing protein [Silvibacterium sp.]|nr:histidine kinase dimerization/phospho-acceptor domain-containing protein [Silvibacterium sp.]